MSEVTAKGPIPRPVLKGRHIRHVFKIVYTSLGAATVGSAIFAYYGIYKLHNDYRTWWGNFDQDARTERIKVSYIQFRNSLKNNGNKYLV